MGVKLFPAHCFDHYHNTVPYALQLSPIIIPQFMTAKFLMNKNNL